jgi:hypothetical protein
MTHWGEKAQAAKVLASVVIIAEALATLVIPEAWGIPFVADMDPSIPVDL